MIFSTFEVVHSHFSLEFETKRIDEMSAIQIQFQAHCATLFKRQAARVRAVALTALAKARITISRRHSREL